VLIALVPPGFGNGFQRYDSKQAQLVALSSQSLSGQGIW